MRKYQDPNGTVNNIDITTPGFYRVTTAHTPDCLQPRLLCVPLTGFPQWSWFGYRLFNDITKLNASFTLDYRITWDRFVHATPKQAMQALKSGLVIRVGVDAKAKPRYYAQSEALNGATSQYVEPGAAAIWKHDFHEIDDIRHPASTDTIKGFSSRLHRVMDMESILHTKGAEILVENYTGQGIIEPGRW